MRTTMLYVFYALCFFGCKGNGQFAEIERGNIKLQVIAPAKKTGDYRIRVLIQPKAMENKETFSYAMMYRADSLFYLWDSSLGKQYPDHTEFVANGITGGYDYIAHFEQRMKPADKFVFDDRHATKTQYEINVNIFK